LTVPFGRLVEVESAFFGLRPGVGLHFQRKKAGTKQEHTVELVQAAEAPPPVRANQTIEPCQLNA